MPQHQTRTQSRRNDVLDRKVYYAGDVVFKEGDAGTNAYVIQSGQVEIVKNRDGALVLLGTLGKGAIFGEMALIDDAPRMATARVPTQTTLIIVSGDTFCKKLSQADPLISKLLAILVDNVRSLADNNVTALEE